MLDSQSVKTTKAGRRSVATFWFGGEGELEWFAWFLDQGAMPWDEEMRQMELFAEHIIPAFR